VSAKDLCKCGDERGAHRRQTGECLTCKALGPILVKGTPCQQFRLAQEVPDPIQAVEWFWDTIQRHEKVNR
jgi:hypothetical protein